MSNRPLLLVLAASGITCQHTGSKASGGPVDARPTISIGSHEARFALPVGIQPIWQWYLPDTRDNMPEYRWEIVTDPPQHDFGFYLFKRPGARPDSGSLADLLRTGQRSVWEPKPTGGARVVREARVDVTPADSGVLVSITDPWTLNLVFGARPVTGTIFLKSPGTPLQRTSIRFAYPGK